MIVNNLEAPEEWKSTNDWDSHRPALWLALENNPEGHPIAEFGSGHGSTPLLYSNSKIGVLSFENDKEWRVHPDTQLVEGYTYLTLPDGFILFIDSKPGEERKTLLAHNKNKYVLIIHDTEPGAEYVYGMADILSTFKYRLDYAPEGKPWTTLVSNHVNVEKWIL